MQQGWRRWVERSDAPDGLSGYGTLEVWGPQRADLALNASSAVSPFDWTCTYCGSVHAGGTYKCPSCGANKGA